MSRRKSSKNSLLVVVGVPVLVVGLGAILWKVTHRKSSLMSGLPQLHVHDYYENANSLRGNTYQLTATVEDSLRWVSGQGRLISVLPSDESGKPGDPLPICIPSDITENIQAGQEFAFKLNVGDGGVLKVEAMERR